MRISCILQTRHHAIAALIQVTTWTRLVRLGIHHDSDQEPRTKRVLKIHERNNMEDSRARYNKAIKGLYINSGGKNTYH